MNESDQNARHFSVGWREQLDLDASSSPAANLDLQWHLAAWEPVMHFWSEVFSDLAPGKRVLECGGATGRLPIYMARDGWQFTVIDITSEGPLLARERCSRAGVRGYFATADVFQLPFDDSTFDVVTSHGLLDLLTDIDSAVKEMARVLKPGGLFTATAYPRRFSVQTVADVVLMLPRAVSTSRRTRSSARRSQRPHRNNYSRQLRCRLRSSRTRARRHYRCRSVSSHTIAIAPATRLCAAHEAAAIGESCLQSLASRVDVHVGNDARHLRRENANP